MMVKKKSEIKSLSFIGILPNSLVIVTFSFDGVGYPADELIEEIELQEDKGSCLKHPVDSWKVAVCDDKDCKE